jgi:hypothetical protein
VQQVEGADLALILSSRWFAHTDSNVQSYGGDLLYKHIHLKKPHKLNQLADRLVRASAEGSNPAENTVSLRLSFRGLNVSYVDSLLCVLHHTSGLRVFGAHEPVMPSVLLTMPRQTVMDLSLVVGTPSGASLAILHSFTHLTSLIIHDDLNPVIPNYPLVLPSLHTLQWTASAFISPSQVQYLARSKLPALKRLNFGLPLLSAADAHLLRTFFLAHTHVQRIELALPFIALAGLFSSLGAPTLAFPSSVPPASIASLHNPAVRTLAFRTKLPGDDVWPLLDTFVRAPPGMLRAIIVSTPSRFTWTCGERDDVHATFVGKMLSHSVRLRTRGIDIVDEDGQIAISSSPMYSLGVEELS